MENQSEKLDHQVAGLPSLCLASSRIQFSVHTGVTASEPDGLLLSTPPAFFAAVVRKKLGLKLESKKADGERLYGIVAGKAPADAAGDQPSE